MTGYHIKKTLSDEDSANAISFFFSEHFPQFIGKHTEWLLLNEPDLDKIDAIMLNTNLKELKHIYELFTRKQNEEQNEEEDYNKLVEALGEE